MVCLPQSSYPRFLPFMLYQNILKYINGKEILKNSKLFKKTEKVYLSNKQNTLRYTQMLSLFTLIDACAPSFQCTIGSGHSYWFLYYFSV